MPKYIDVDLVISELKSLNEQERLEYMGVYDCIKSVPTADVQEIRHGKWKEVYRNDIAIVYECTNCKHLTFGISDYCICGTKMDGKEDEE